MALRVTGPYPEAVITGTRKNLAARWLRRFAIAAILCTLACTSAPEFRGHTLDTAAPAHLEGVNWDGSEFDLASLDHDVVVVFFGYTFCPDVCPMTLGRMKQVLAELDERQAERVGVVFVSVDPERDTLDKLADYVPHFDRRFYGVRLDDDALEEAKLSFGVSSRNVDPPSGGENGFYFVDHTGSVFLLDASGRPRVSHPNEAPLADVVADVEALLAAGAA